MRCPAPYALYTQTQIFRDDKNVERTGRIKHVFVGEFELSQIGNMDEVPPTFDVPSNKLDVTVKKSITVKTTSNRLVIDQRSQGIKG